MLQVKMEKFEGPLDLLLKLIKNEKLDITEISLVKIADQYITYIETSDNLSAGEIADFLLVAAKLIFLKSKILLPKISEDEEEEDELIEQLKIYKKYLDAAKKIELIIRKRDFLFTRAKNAEQQEFFNPPLKIDKKKLSEIFKNFILLSKQSEIEFEQGSLKKRISIQDKIAQMLDLIKRKKNFVFNSVFFAKANRDEKVVSFLAILEIIKQKNALVVQEELFADIVVRI
ncbi:segregation/condensation protein A [Candidatus Parcubacteria bacterium]|nr:segregation/condensation protein A [Candidatus Parcubacteria bacterium]